MTLFSRIIRREIPAEIIYEDDQCMAFKDIDPQAPSHFLLVPKKEISSLSDAQPGDQALLGHLLLKAAEIAQKQGLNGGYRIMVNTGADGGQTIFHLHLHILGGKEMPWPPA